MIEAKCVNFFANIFIRAVVYVCMIQRSFTIESISRLFIKFFGWFKSDRPWQNYVVVE